MTSSAQLNLALPSSTAAPADPAPDAAMVQASTQTSAADVGALVVLAVDGDNLFHRAYHAYARTGTVDAQGRPAWAPAGFVTMLSKLISAVRPDRLVVGFDDTSASRRAELFGDYKANRKPRDPDVGEQRRATIRLLDGLGVRTEIHAGAEADDVIAAAAVAAERLGWRCVIATSDRDSFATISDSTSVMHLASGVNDAPLLDAAALVDLVGVPPERYHLLAALRGDSSDNLAGVPGFGKKTAATLAAAVDADTILADPAAAAAGVVSPRCVQALVDNVDVVARNLELMALDESLPVDVTVAELYSDDDRAREIGALYGAVGPARKLMSVMRTVHVPVERYERF